MSQSAAHLVDNVIPRVPVRQWALSLPIPLRLLLAAQPVLVTPLLQVVHRVITRHLPGALRHAPVQAAVAVTGVAGPTGGSPAKPVGTVWFGWNVDGVIHTGMQRIDGDRAAVRAATVIHALARLLDLLQAHGDLATP